MALLSRVIRFLLPAPTDAVKNVTVSVYRARRGSDAVSVLVQWALLTAEQLQGKGKGYKVEVLQQGQVVTVSAYTYTFLQCIVVQYLLRCVVLCSRTCDITGVL